MLQEILIFYQLVWTFYKYNYNNNYLNGAIKLFSNLYLIHSFLDISAKSSFRIEWGKETLCTRAFKIYINQSFSEIIQLIEIIKFIFLIIECTNVAKLKNFIPKIDKENLFYKNNLKWNKSIMFFKSICQYFKSTVRHN